jgi:uncharacterized protein YcbK (DUF882 family)
MNYNFLFYKSKADFKVREFRSKCGSDLILIDVEFVQNVLQKIREHFAKPVKIISAYRSEKHNAKVGGAKSSFHLSGRAFDIQIKGIKPSEIAVFAQSLGVDGIIIYDKGFCHLDSRTVKYFANNINGKAITVSSFA